MTTVNRKVPTLTHRIETDTRVGTLRNIVIGQSTRQVIGPHERETVKVSDIYDLKTRKFVKDVMKVGEKDSFQLLDLERKIGGIENAIESADGQGMWNAKNGKYNQDELNRAAQKNADVIPFVELLNGFNKLGM